MSVPAPDSKIHDLESLVADLRQTATMLQRELEDVRASVPTPGDCSTASGEALYALGCAVLRARRAEREAKVAREQVAALRVELAGVQELYREADAYSSAWSEVHDAVVAALEPRSPNEAAADVVARVREVAKLPGFDARLRQLEDAR